MERFGLVGLPNAGKTSLCNALTGATALVAPYAFATTDPNVGIAQVPDDRLDALAQLSGSDSVVHATVQFTDIGGLVEGASRGEGLGNQFLAGIREVDAIVYVLRAFDAPDVVGATEPLDHLSVLEIELSLADLESAETQLDKKRRQVKGDHTLAGDVAALERAVEALAEGTPIYRSSLSAAERQVLRTAWLLTNKPILAVVNVGEDQLDVIDELCRPVAEELQGADVIGLCIQLEAEASQLPDAEQAEMREGLGLGDGALPSLLRAAYHLLGLRTFFTTAPNETRAWPFRDGSTAAQCAGLVHTDFQRGFIKADTIHCEELLEIGSWQGAKEAGRVRSEGRDYIVNDGDVMLINFNV